MRPFGTHLRFSLQLEEVIEKALFYQIPIFQSFFINNDGVYCKVTPELVAYYHHMRHYFSNMFAHSSYLINLADSRIEYHPYLRKELTRAQRLGFSHLVIHPGSVTGSATKTEALDTLVKRINAIITHENDIALVIENSAHAKRALGGDLNDLYYIRCRLDEPEKVTFCIDTAHAYVFGYDLKDGLDEFIDNVDELFGDSVSLLHLNDTYEQLGSQQDRHSLLGQGELGLDVLKRCAQHPVFENVPIILELPETSEHEELQALEIVRSWFR